MAIRVKSKRRLAYLGIGLLVLLAGLAGLYAYRKHAQRQEILGFRKEGLAQAQRGEYREALQTLGRYLPQHKTDVEALYPYAKSRWKVEEPRGRHLQQAIGLMRRVLELDPGHAQARHDLLEIYVAVGFQTETLETADLILKTAPQDIPALRAKAVALGRLNRFREALPVAEALTALQPDDLDAHFLTFSILRGMDTPATDLVARAAKLAQDRPDDPRSLLMQGFLHQLANNRDRALECYRAAAAKAPRDKELVARLVGLLDATGQYRESLSVLERAGGADAEPPLRRLLAWRLFQTDRLQPLVDATANLDPAAADTDSDLLALRALALARLQKIDEARALVAAMAQRQDSVARGWSPLLGYACSLEPITPAKRVALAQDSVSAQPGNPCLRLFLADARAELGENSAALKAFVQAAQLAPAWHLPLVRAAQVSLAAGRPGPALDLVREAVHRAPESLSTAIAFAEVAMASVTDSDDKRPQDLLKLVDQIQQAIPGEPRTLALKGALMARLGDKDGAARLIQGLLTGQDAPDTDTLLRLASVSNRFGLDLEDQILSRCEQGRAPHPLVVLARAGRLAAAGKPDEGRKLLEAAVAAAPPDQPVWRLTFAGYLDRTRDPAALGQWKALGEAFPAELAVQRALLESPVAAQDRALADQAITRLRQITGEEGVAWRFYRARWLLSGPNDPRSDAEAVSLLTEVVHADPAHLPARLVLAAALDRGGNRSAALDHLAAAAALDPRLPAIALHQAQLLIQQGDLERAGAALDRLQPAAATPEQLRVAAQVSLHLGRLDAAARFLEQAPAGASPAADAELLHMYARLGWTSRVEPLLESLLQKPTGAAVELGAEFYASTGRMAKARQTLDLLDKVPEPPATRCLIRGQFLLRHGDREQGLEQYRQATLAAPKDPRTWLALLSVLLDAGQPEPIIATARSAGQAIPDHPGLAALNSNVELVTALAAVEVARPILRAAVLSAEHRAAAIAALRVMHDLRARQAPATALLDELLPLAERHSRFFELQAVVVRLSMASQRPADAVNVAARTAEALPASADAAQLAAEACIAAQRWGEALAAGRRWRQRLPANPAPADLLIAEAQIQLGHPAEAAAQLSPYLQPALQEPDRHPDTLILHCRAQIALGETAPVERTLRPLLAKDPRWQSAWIRLAALALPDPLIAARWLEEVGKLIPADAAPRRLELAQGWHVLAMRLKAPAALDAARHVYADLAAATQPAPGTLLAAATFFDGTGDRDAAEKHYRRVLEIAPDPVAQNNLAMILIDRQAPADQVLALARMADDAAQHSSPAFLDTLALAYLYAGQPAQALPPLRKAVQLDSRNARWRVNLAYALVQAGQTTEARELLARLDAEHADLESLPPAFRNRLSEIREKLTRG